MVEESGYYELLFFESLARKNPDFVDALVPLAELYTKQGLYAKGLEIDERLAKLRNTDPIVQYNLACSLALVGRSDEAVRSLKHAIHLGYSDLDYMRRDQDLKSLYNDPTFQKLLREGSEEKES